MVAFFCLVACALFASCLSCLALSCAVCLLLLWQHLWQHLLLHLLLHRLLHLCAELLLHLCAELLLHRGCNTAHTPLMHARGRANARTLTYRAVAFADDVPDGTYSHDPTLLRCFFSHDRSPPLLPDLDPIAWIHVRSRSQDEERRDWDRRRCRGVSRTTALIDGRRRKTTWTTWTSWTRTRGGRA